MAFERRLAKRLTMGFLSLFLLYPGEPWKWDHRTVSGIFDATPGWVPSAAVAVLWNLFCWLIAFAVWNEVETSSELQDLVIP